MAEKSNVAVIGLGRFGSSIARSLYNIGHDVLAIDLDAVSYTHLTLPTSDLV